MTAGTSGRFVPVDLHQHEEAVAEDAPSPPPSSPSLPLIDGDGECCADAGGIAPGEAGRLWREDGRVMFQPAGGGRAVAVRLVWARPLSGRGGPVSVMQAGKKREVAYLPDLAALPPESRRVAEEELSGGMVMPVVTAVNGVKSRIGNYYWDVETDMGRRRFLFTAPENNTFRPDGDSLILRDVSGNCYEIRSLSGLSRASRREVERVL